MQVPAASTGLAGERTTTCKPEVFSWTTPRLPDLSPHHPIPGLPLSIERRSTVERPSSVPFDALSPKSLTPPSSPSPRQYHSVVRWQFNNTAERPDALGSLLAPTRPSEQLWVAQARVGIGRRRFGLA